MASPELPLIANPVMLTLSADMIKAGTFALAFKMVESEE